MKCQPLNLTMFLFKAFLKIKDKECRSIRHAKRLFLSPIGCTEVIETWESILSMYQTVQMSIYQKMN